MVKTGKNQLNTGERSPRSLWEDKRVYLSFRIKGTKTGGERSLPRSLGVPKLLPGKKPLPLLHQSQPSNDRDTKQIGNIKAPLQLRFNLANSL